MRSGSQSVRHAQTFVLGHVRDVARAFMRGSIRQSYLRRSLRRAILAPTRPLRLIVGGGHKLAPRGWHLTDAELLDITRPGDWQALLGARRVDALLAEHVWEHLTLEQGLGAAGRCNHFLREGGTLRIAVPDGLHPHDTYRDHVRPGGDGPGAGNHKTLFDHRSLIALLEEAGFEAHPLEYWDEEGWFHHEPWRVEDGPVRRRPRFPPEAGRFVRDAEYARANEEGITAKRRVTSEIWPFNYTSLIVDARKPATA